MYKPTFIRKNDPFTKDPIIDDHMWYTPSPVQDVDHVVSDSLS